MTVDLTTLSSEERAALIKQAQELEQKERTEKREAYEAVKADAVITLVNISKDINEQLTNFKAHAFETMETLGDLLKEYSGRYAEGKGNFKVEYGDYKIEYNKQGKGSYDERSSEAEK